MNKRFCPPHLRGLPVGRSYHGNSFRPSGAMPVSAKPRLALDLETNKIGPSKGFNEIPVDNIEEMRKHFKMPDPYQVTGQIFGTAIDKEALDALYNAPAPKPVFNFEVKTPERCKCDASCGESRSHKRGSPGCLFEPNPILEGLKFNPAPEPTYRYERVAHINAPSFAMGGTVTGRIDHTQPNPTAVPRHPNIEEVDKVKNFIRYVKETDYAPMPTSTPPKSDQPQRDVNAVVRALEAGRDKADAFLIGELALQPGSSVERLLTEDFMQLHARVVKWRQEVEKRKDFVVERDFEKQPVRSANAVIAALDAGRNLQDAKNIGELIILWPERRLSHLLRETTNDLRMALNISRNSERGQKARAAFLQPVLDTVADGCSATPPGQEKPKIKISIYLDDGIVFDYDVSNATSAREHVSAIIKTGYRHSDSETPDELVHFPPHRILKVKMRGPGITTMYYDRPRGT